MADLNVFSLEDDDCPELFITQSCSNNVSVQEEVDNFDLDMVFGENADDFKLANVPILGEAGMQFSEISDSEVFEELKPMR